MTTRLHIVTSCVRPWNIPRIAEFYLCRMERHPFELRWHISVQGPDKDYKGCNKTNEAIDSIKDGWLFFFADDTVQHQSIFRRLGEVVSANPDARVVVFSQQRGPDVLRSNPECCIPGKVCGGMFAVEREFLGELRFDYPLYGSLCDGFLVQKLHEKDASRFVFVDEVLARFNSIEECCYSSSISISRTP